MLPIDYESYALDLEKSNIEDRPIWYKKYDYREYYKFDNLSPNSFFNYSNT
jgi:hypothetical protein